MASYCDIRVKNIKQSKQIERIPIVNSKSGLATPVITQSAQADLVCVAAISIAASKTDNTIAASKTDNTIAASKTDNTIAASKRGNTIAASKTDNTIASSKGVIKTDLV